MELYLIRHGQSHNNAHPEEQRVEDAPLTTLGQEQAALLANFAKSLRLTRLITSPFMRALQTTDPVRQTTGLQPEIWVDLHEQGGCYAGHIPGQYVGRPGMTHTELAAQFPEFQNVDDIDGDGWWQSKAYETNADARQRAARVLDRTRDTFALTSERVAFVMHADFMRYFVACVLDVSSRAPHNASVTKLVISQDDSRVEYFNRTEHLPEQMKSC